MIFMLNVNIFTMEKSIRYFLRQSIHLIKKRQPLIAKRDEAAVISVIFDLQVRSYRNETELDCAPYLIPLISSSFWTLCMASMYLIVPLFALITSEEVCTASPE